MERTGQNTTIMFWSKRVKSKSCKRNWSSYPETRFVQKMHRWLILRIRRSDYFNGQWKKRAIPSLMCDTSWSAQNTHLLQSTRGTCKSALVQSRHPFFRNALLFLKIHWTTVNWLKRHGSPPSLTCSWLIFGLNILSDCTIWWHKVNGYVHTLIR